MQSGPRKGSRNDGQHIQICPRPVLTELTQTPLSPLSASDISFLSLLFLSFLAVCRPGFRDRRAAPREQTQREEEEEEVIKTGRQQEPGAEAGMRQVFLCIARVCACKCAHVCCVLGASRLSTPSMRLLLESVVVSVALPGCSALFSPAVADAAVVAHWFLRLTFC